MTQQNEVAWHERLAEWQGEMNVTIRELNKNQDELQERIAILRVDNAVLQSLARQAGKRWGVVGGIISGVVVGVVSTLIFHFIIF